MVTIVIQVMTKSKLYCSQSTVRRLENAQRRKHGKKDRPAPGWPGKLNAGVCLKKWFAASCFLNKLAQTVTVLNAQLWMQFAVLLAKSICASSVTTKSIFLILFIKERSFLEKATNSCSLQNSSMNIGVYMKMVRVHSSLWISKHY